MKAYFELEPELDFEPEPELENRDATVRFSQLNN